MIFGKGHRSETRLTLLLALGALCVAPLIGCGGGGGGTPDGSPTPDPNGRATFTGRVVDGNNGDRGVQAAYVTINGTSVYTGADGGFTLEGSTSTGITYGTVLGPGGNYYATGYVSGSQYNVVSPGFPIQPISAGQSRNLGTIRIASQDGPPFPPPFN